jgi:hypothetical protein
MRYINTVNNNNVDRLKKQLNGERDVTVKLTEK